MIAALIVFLFPVFASAQVVEESLARVKDRPPCLGFFVPDGGTPVTGVVVSRDIGYCFMFTQAQGSAITEGAQGYFCLSPLFYYGSISGIEKEGALRFVPINADELDITDARVANYADIEATRLSSMYAAVAESGSMQDDGNIKLNYRLFPVKAQGGYYRIMNFLYTKDVTMGAYPLFGRTASDNSIVFLGYLNIGGNNTGTVAGVNLD
jgi:hypothetical protein